MIYILLQAEMIQPSRKSLKQIPPHIKYLSISPSPGEPSALPRHRDGEAEDLVGQLGLGQVHPQLEPVAERHDDPRSQMIPDDDPSPDVQDHHKVPLNS